MTDRNTQHDEDEEESHGKKETPLKIPSAISIRDVIIIVTAVITVVSAWGVYGTRLALVEDKIIQHEKKIDVLQGQALTIQQKDIDLTTSIIELRAKLQFLEQRGK